VPPGRGILALLPSASQPPWSVTTSSSCFSLPESGASHKSQVTIHTSPPSCFWLPESGASHRVTSHHSHLLLLLLAPRERCQSQSHGSQGSHLLLLLLAPRERSRVNRSRASVLLVTAPLVVLPCPLCPVCCSLFGKGREPLSERITGYLVNGGGVTRIGSYMAQPLTWLHRLDPRVKQVGMGRPFGSI